VRFNTVQPTQALSMFNGALTNSLAMDLALRVLRERPESLRLQLSWARERTAGRVPSVQDLDESEAFIAELRDRDGLTIEQAMQAYCLVLYNLNDFLTVD
jgi:DNA-binding GntR family transcriptional regulator